MRVIFVNRFFHPDISATSVLLSDLAFNLAKRGRSVHVVTSRLRYEAVPGDAGSVGLPAKETVAGVTIHRVWTTRFGRGSLSGRAADYLTFYLSAAWCLWRLARAGDAVVAKTDPPIVSVVAAVACRLRSAQLVNWLQDLFPEVARASGLGARWRLAYAILATARTASLRAAVANVVIGEGMATRVEALGIPADRVRVIRNWADPELIRPIAHVDNPFRAEAGLGDAFVVAYSGNLGRVHDIATPIEAMTILAERSARQDGRRPVRWLFIGGGALTKSLQAEITRRGLSSVSFLPYQPAVLLAQSLSAADAHLVTLRPEFEGLVVPSKVAGATAAGRPILFVGDPHGEIAGLIARHGCGHTIGPDDGPALARAIVALADDPVGCDTMGCRARQAFDAEFARDAALARWDNLLGEVLHRPAAGSLPRIVRQDCR